MMSLEPNEGTVRDVTRDPVNPELYPPRVLPKSIKRRQKDNRAILSSLPVEDHIVFSGFYHNEHHHDTTRHRFRELIGKQNVAQELDLIAYIQPRAAKPHNTSATTTTTSGSSHHHHGHSSSHQHVSVQQVKFVGTALATFPHELRCHFGHLLINSVHQARIAPGTTLQGLHTNLGPFVFATNTPPSHFSNFDLDKHQMLHQVGLELLAQVSTFARPRYMTRFLTHTVQKQKKYKRSGKRGPASSGGDEDGEEKKKNRDGKKREEGDEDDDVEGTDDSDASSDDTENDDYDYGINDDDDDDDYEGGGSGNDEPTF